MEPADLKKYKVATIVLAIILVLALVSLATMVALYLKQHKSVSKTVSDAMDQVRIAQLKSQDTKSVKVDMTPT